MFIPTLFLLALWLPPMLAQDYSIPSQWVNTTCSLGRDARIQLAQGLLDTLSTSFDKGTGQIPSLGFGQNANMLSAITIHDSIVAKKDNYNITSDLLSGARTRLIPTIQGIVTNDPLMWGLTAVYAFRAYQERTFLDDATAIWEEITPWKITQDDADRGSHPLKNGTLSSICGGVSLTGGIFYHIDDPNKNDLGIVSSSEGAYMALSAYLYDVTGNDTFADAASDAHAFTQAHLYNSTGDYIMDGCAGGPVVTYDTGLYLEALSVLANSTKNSTLMQMADQLAFNAMTSPVWTMANGTLLDPAAPLDVSDNSHWNTAYKGMLVRALYEHWTRSQEDSPISNLIKTFLTVQYNAAITFARSPRTDFYTYHWSGPPATSMTPWGQLAAADVLNSAIGLIAEPSPIPIPSNTAVTPNTAPPNPQHHLPLGPIIGGAVGGILLVAIISIAILRAHMRRRRKATLRGHMTDEPNMRHRSIIRGNRDSDSFPVSVDPFPPPFPSIDYFNSSKMRNETRIIPSTTPPPDFEPQSSPPAPAAEVIQPALPSESSGGSRDNIEDLVYRLNMAMAHLPPPSMDGSSTTAPPRYENIA